MSPSYSFLFIFIFYFLIPSLLHFSFEIYIFYITFDFTFFSLTFSFLLFSILLFTSLFRHSSLLNLLPRISFPNIPLHCPSISVHYFALPSLLPSIPVNSHSITLTYSTKFPLSLPLSSSLVPSLLLHPFLFTFFTPKKSLFFFLDPFPLAESSFSYLPPPLTPPPTSALYLPLYSCSSKVVANHVDGKRC